MGWDPLSVAYLTYLNASGMGNNDTSCITVAGKQVDAVRKDFAGVIPASGGAKIKDKKAPKLNIKKSQQQDDQWYLSLETEPETNKVEVFIDGKLREPVITSGYKNISLDIGALNPGDHEVTIYAYDRFLNQAKAKVNIKIQNISKDK